MSLKKIKERISELEENISDENINESKIPQQILSEMKEIGIEKLPYSYSALRRFIDAETMNIHYNKHYKGYLEKLNKALKNRDGGDMELEEIVRTISKFPKLIKNNAGGAFNHALFWKMLSPRPQRVGGNILNAIKKDFKSFDNFKKKFEEESQSKFGSGWVWLILGKRGNLRIVTSSNQDNPLMNTFQNGGYPLLGLDLWEHAYYLKYRNKKDDYIKNFWGVVNWDFVNDLYSLKTDKKLQETKTVKDIISEATQVQGCNYTQIKNYKNLFNENPLIKENYRRTIDNILERVYKDYWYEKNEYAPNTLSGVYDYEKKGRSVINKLNTNYTNFCTLVTDVNAVLKKYGQTPLSFLGESQEKQVQEMNRLSIFLEQFADRIFSPNSQTFQKIMNSLTKNDQYGDKQEEKAVLKMNQFFSNANVTKEGGLGVTTDALAGKDAVIKHKDGKLEYAQIKPFGFMEENEDSYILSNTGQVKKYNPSVIQYLVFISTKGDTYIFKNENVDIVEGKYVIPKDNWLNK